MIDSKPSQQCPQTVPLCNLCQGLRKRGFIESDWVTIGAVSASLMQISVLSGKMTLIMSVFGDLSLRDMPGDGSPFILSLKSLLNEYETFTDMKGNLFPIYYIVFSLKFDSLLWSLKVSDP